MWQMYKHPGFLLINNYRISCINSMLYVDYCKSSQGIVDRNKGFRGACQALIGEFQSSLVMVTQRIVNLHHGHW